MTGDGTPLSFIGQISTGDISVPDGCPPLPPGSLLAFFYEATGQEAWGNDPADAPFWRVIAVPRGAAVPVTAPGGAEVFSAHQVVPEHVITAPDQDEPVNDEFLLLLDPAPGPAPSPLRPRLDDPAVLLRRTFPATTA